MELLEKACQVSKQDIVLDVACGAGIVTCYLARLAYHVTGIDVTPAMIERCRDRQSKENLANLSWHVGDVLPLPMADASFTLWNRDPQGTPLFAMKCFGCFISLHPLAVQEHSLNDLGLA